jgi:single-strand DNA-binding protein
MPSLNTCQFVGRLGRDPEMKFTTAGKPVTGFSLAVDHNRKLESGEWEQDTEWVRVVAWGDLAERTAEHLRKGRLAYVEGRMKTRSWVGRDDGVKHYATEIIANRAFALDKRPEDGAEPAPVAQVAVEPSDLDDLPF